MGKYYGTKMSELLLEVKNLKISTKSTDLVKDISFQLNRGSTLGIVGESGSGKSLTSLCIMGLLAKDLKAEGSIKFLNKELLKLSEDDFLKIRGKEIGMIFQEPMTALNPTMKCGVQVEEVLLRHLDIGRKEAQNRVIELFKQVDLPRPGILYEAYPHEISGGQKQRVVIAMAIACRPKLLIADEPTTAIDATVQNSILKLLKKLCSDYEMGMIFISHDLGVVKSVADEMMVMYRGEMVEYGDSKEIFSAPKNPYTKGLLACRPTAETSFTRLPVVSDFMNNERPKLKLRTLEGRLAFLSEVKSKPPLLKLSGIGKVFGKKVFLSKTNLVRALEDVTIEVYEGETLGLVGESGSGKTTLGRILSGLETATAGSVFYRNKDITKLSRGEWRTLHKEIQIIFQDPFSSLNPRIKTGNILTEVLSVQTKLDAKARKEKSMDLLRKVGLEESHFDRYPHEFSGGQRQRIGIARALAVNPRFIVCDESVSALDVSVQAQILNLLNDLKDEFGFTYLFISHDLAVVKYFADRVMVLQNGELVEVGASDDLYLNPKTDYTKKLIASSFN